MTLVLKLPGKCDSQGPNRVWLFLSVAAYTNLMEAGLTPLTRRGKYKI